MSGLIYMMGCLRKYSLESTEMDAKKGTKCVEYYIKVVFCASA